MEIRTGQGVYVGKARTLTFKNGTVGASGPLSNDVEQVLKEGDVAQTTHKMVIKEAIVKGDGVLESTRLQPNLEDKMTTKRGGQESEYSRNGR